jgi:hypothetical protein
VTVRVRVRKQLRAFGRVFHVLSPFAGVAARLLIYTAVFRLLFTVTCEPAL